MGKEANKQSWTRFLRYCVILLITGVTALAWVSVLTFHPADPPATAMFPPPQVHNAAGMVGSHISYSLLYWLGDGSYMLLLFLSACMLLMLLGGRITDLPWRIVGVALMARRQGDMKTALPFGVFLAPAAMIAWLWGAPLVAWYARLLRP